MRIVHVCRVAPPSVGGMEAVVAGLATRQAAAGHAVRWVSLEAAPAAVEGVEVVGLRRVGPARFPFALGLAAALRGADVVHVHGVDGLLGQVIGARPPGARVGVSTHGGFLHSRRAWLAKQVVRRTWLARQLRAADAVWLTSEVDRALLVAGQVAEVVPNGAALRPLLDAPRRPQRGVWVIPGRVDAHKGHADALRALAAARAAGGGPSRVEVIGAAPDARLLARLRRLAVSLGLGDVVTWRGRVSEASWRDALLTAEVALFPSRHEAFGVALVEAMAAGVAPVASPIPAHAAQVVEGETGNLVDFAAPNAGGRLVAVAASDRAGMSDRARAAAARWDWSAILPRWEAAYAALGAR